MPPPAPKPYFHECFFLKECYLNYPIKKIFSIIQGNSICQALSLLSASIQFVYALSKPMLADSVMNLTHGLYFGFKRLIDFKNW
jgi:hypothetical protein